MRTTIYSLHTGEILRNVDADAANLAVQCGPDEGYILSASDDATEYVELIHTRITPKGDYTVEDIPVPCNITIEGVEYSCSTTPVISFAEPGEYVVQVDAGHAYLKKEFVLNVD